MTRELYYKLMSYYREKQFIRDKVDGFTFLFDEWRYKIDFVRFWVLGTFKGFSIKN